MIAACASPVPLAPTFPAFTVLHPPFGNRLPPLEVCATACGWPSSSISAKVQISNCKVQKAEPTLNSNSWSKSVHFVIVACFSFTSSELLKMVSRYFLSVNSNLARITWSWKKGLNPQYSLCLESLSKERPKARRARNPNCKSTIAVVQTLVTWGGSLIVPKNDAKSETPIILCYLYQLIEHEKRGKVNLLRPPSHRPSHLFLLSRIRDVSIASGGIHPRSVPLCPIHPPGFSILFMFDGRNAML